MQNYTPHTIIILALLMAKTACGMDTVKKESSIYTPESNKEHSATQALALLEDERKIISTADPTEALYHAAYSGSCPHLISSLLEKGGKLWCPKKIKDSMHQPPRGGICYPLLHIAVARAHVAMVETLISNGEDVNACDLGGYMPLHYVFYGIRKKEPWSCDMVENTEQHYHCAQLLLYKKADPNIPFPGTSITPLDAALIDNNSSLTRLLIIFGAKITELMVKTVVILNNTLLLETFMEQGANPNITDNDGMSLLHLAAGEGNIDTIKILLDYGAMLNAPNKKGHTPLDWALIRKRSETVEFLRKQGATVKIDT